MMNWFVKYKTTRNPNIWYRVSFMGFALNEVFENLRLGDDVLDLVVTSFSEYHHPGEPSPTITEIVNGDPGIPKTEPLIDGNRRLWEDVVREATPGMTHAEIVEKREKDEVRFQPLVNFPVAHEAYLGCESDKPEILIGCDGNYDIVKDGLHYEAHFVDDLVMSYNSRDEHDACIVGSRIVHHLRTRKGSLDNLPQELRAMGFVQL